jgi:hypothetical protein
MKILRKENAFKLLRRLESTNYMITENDKWIMNHKSFKIYRSEHVKKLVGGSFFRALRNLLENGRLSYDDFNDITKPASNWYRQKFIDSFFYHCTNPKGQFYNYCQGKKLIKSSGINHKNGEIEECFFCN